MTRGSPPRLEDVVAGTISPRDRERLERVHALLVDAGPPAELPPALETLPAGEPPGTYPLFPRRRWAALATIGLAVAAAAFGAGYLLGDDTGRAAERVVPLAATQDAPGASGSLSIFAPDEAGNRRLELTVQGLEPLPQGRGYALELARDATSIAEIGTFAADPGPVDVVLTSPVAPRVGDRWQIVGTGSADPLLVSGPEPPRAAGSG